MSAITEEEVMNVVHQLIADGDVIIHTPNALKQFFFGTGNSKAVA